MEISEQKTQFYNRRPQRETAVSPTPSNSTSPDTIWMPLPKKRRRLLPPASFKAVLLGFGIAGLIMTLLLGTAGAILFVNSPIIFPNVMVGDLPVGTLTRADAADVLQTAWAQQRITLAAGDTEWQVSPAELGLSLDSSATVQQAHNVARSWDSWQTILAHRGQVTIQPVWLIDPTAAELFLQSKADELYVPAQDARIEIENGRVLTIPAVPGQTVDVTTTANWLMQNVGQVVENGRLDLITLPVDPSVTDVSAIAEQATALLTTSVSVRAYDPVTDDAFTWVLSPAVWGEWLTLSVDSVNASQFDWTLDAAAAQTFLDERTTALGGSRYLNAERAVTAVSNAIQSQQTAVNLRLYHHEQTHTVQSGETLAGIGRDYGIPYPWIQAANPAVGDGLTVGQVLTIPSPDEMLPLPVIENKRIVVSISQQKTWVYENGVLKWEWLASTGIDSSPTAPGVFQIQTHEPNAYAGNWNLWMPNFMGIYRPVPNSDFMNGFHGFPTRDGANLLWTNNLGTKVTYGCVLLSNDNVAQLYDWAEAGVVVEIRP